MYLEFRLVEWAMREHKRFRGHRLCAFRWVQESAYLDSAVFVNWQLLCGPPCSHYNGCSGRAV